MPLAMPADVRSHPVRCPRRTSIRAPCRPPQPEIPSAETRPRPSVSPRRDQTASRRTRADGKAGHPPAFVSSPPPPAREPWNQFRRTVRTCDEPYFSASFHVCNRRRIPRTQRVTALGDASGFALCDQSIRPACRPPELRGRAHHAPSEANGSDGLQSLPLPSTGMLGTTPIPGIPRLSTPIQTFILVFLQNGCEGSR